MNDILLEWSSTTHIAKVMVEITARNAYAYLCVDERIVADVWLFNVGEAPPEPEWADPSRAPFCNPKDYCSPALFEGAIDPETEIACRFVAGPDSGALHYCEITINGRVHAILVEGKKPGYCRLAAKEGLLAKPLDAFNFDCRA